MLCVSDGPIYVPDPWWPDSWNDADTQTHTYTHTDQLNQPSYPDPGNVAN